MYAHLHFDLSHHGIWVDFMEFFRGYDFDDDDVMSVFIL